MKIGVMSDTHLTRVSAGLRKIVEEYFRHTDMILHAGDIVSGGVLEYLEAAGVTAVRGNMDWPDVAARLPTKRVIQVGGVSIGLIHGWGSPEFLADRLRPEFAKIDCLVFGHSHWTTNRLKGAELFFNPGSSAEPRRGGRRTVGLLHVDKGVRGEIINID